jgi:DNA-binding HxlR family transcriptional regulator
METISLPQLPVFEKDCSIRIVLDRIADKWTVLVISLLSAGEPRRFSELRRAIEGISQKMLTQTLRDLERDGLISRKIYPEVPPRVEYTLTALGETLCVPIAQLGEWARGHVDEVKHAQAAFDARTAQESIG